MLLLLLAKLLLIVVLPSLSCLHSSSKNKLFSAQMELQTKRSLPILCSPTIVFIHVILVSCLSLLLPSSLAAAASRTGGNETDRLALVNIKKRITSDPFQVMGLWNDSIHFCQWHGITCSEKHQRVTMLELGSQKLVGSISPHIGNMSFLNTLRLNNNSFSQEIPGEIGKLFRLQILSLENNSFDGVFPANITRCSKLIYLGLDSNELVGSIPMEIGNSLSKLQVLALRFNNLTGKIPPSIGNLSSLTLFAASENNLEGSIPDALGKLTNLIYLALGANNLSGMIPLSIYNISSLAHIAVPVNQIQGSLPPDIGLTLPNLRYLFMHTNRLSGPIPVSISNASNLFQLSISRNKFTGRVPSFSSLHDFQGLGIHINNLGTGEDGDLDFLSSLANCTNFEVISISDNNFRGMLPDAIANFSTMFRSLGLARNQIYGSIPAGIGNLFNLNIIALETNQLTGTIPESLGRLAKLNYMYLNGNQLSGEIPSSLGNLTLLYGLNLGFNNLQGTIPSSLGNCRLITLLYLSHNELSGVIAKEVMGLSSLSRFLGLSHNNFTGSLPSEVGSLKNIENLDVSENRLSGEIPSSLGSCVSLVSLLMNGNHFQGTIPSSFSSLKGMEYLHLSSNNLTGQIPKFLGDFIFLRSLNLSFNEFEGEVPVQGVFKNASAVLVVGNQKLCGGIPELQLPKCGMIDSNKGKSSLNLKLIISVVCGFLGLTVVLLIFLITYRFGKKKKELPSESSLDGSFYKLSYDKLFKATAGFSSSNLIGIGGFGSVYKGILDNQNAKVIAVKVLNLQRQGASKSFIAECEALRNIRHRNLVKILTACSSIDFHGNHFKALVYEFMVNGSLEQWLHPVSRTDEGCADPRVLTLLQRLDIAIDIAGALDYLHHGCQTSIVHCDLKPSNILMDSDMTAHVGDFGLATFITETSHVYSEIQTNSIGIKGTIGYAAPEYGMGSVVSTFGDVYSFGIILLEMFTGKIPTDDMFLNGLNLHNYVKMALPEQVMEIADPLLLQNRNEGTITDSTYGNTLPNSYSIEECLIQIFRVGVTCSLESPKERMDMNDVIRELLLVKDIVLGTEKHGGHVPSKQEWHPLLSP